VLAANQVLCQGFKVLALLLLFRSADFVDVCVLIFASEVLRLLGITVLARRGLSKIRYRELFGRRELAEKFLSSVLWINVSDIIDLPVRHLDKIITSAILGPAAAGVYAIFKKLAGVFGIVADALYQATYPVLAQLIAIDHAKAVAMAWNIGKTFFAVGIAPLVALIAFSSLWIPLVIPTLKAGVSLEIGVFFTASFMAMCFIMVHPLYILYGHEKHNASVTAFANGIYLCALWLLTSTLGLLGAVMACAIQYFVIIFIKLAHLRMGFALQTGH
jgi:O-antigen/teichoic acid export membrane protein